MVQSKLTVLMRKLALLVSQMILLLAFGCGPAPTEIVIIFPTPTGSPAPTPTQVAQPSTTESPLPTPTPFVPTAVIKIFSHTPLSGSRADEGQDIFRGAELAIRKLSAPLNEFGFKVELVPYDDQNTVETALANAQGIAGDPEILCGVGHYDSDVTLAASDLYHEAGLAFVAPAATIPLLTERNFLEVNRLIGRADWQGLAAAQFAQAQGVTSVFIVSQRSDNTIRNAEDFRVETGNLGIKRLGSVVTTVTDENRAQIVSQIMNVNPELIYISTAANQAVPLLTALRAAGYAGSFLGTERLHNPSVIRAAGTSLIEGGGLYYTITNPPADYYPNAEDFVQDFGRQYNVSPMQFAARAYDATGICLKAIEEAARTKGGTPPTRGEVARAIRSLIDYEGVTGIYNFNSNGDASPVPYYVYQVTTTDAATWDQNPIIAAYEIIPP
jgi:branched-chain amino acid transport system substrate-binding protein